MKKLILLSWALAAAHFSVAQEKKQFEVKNFKGLINITGPANNLVIAGYNGTAVIIEAETGEGKVPEKAAGLRIVTSGGLDNTGLNVTVEETTNKVVVSIDEKGKEVEEEIQVLNINIANANKMFKNYVVKVPHGLTTRFRESSPDIWGSKGSLKIQSFEGELDVTCAECNLEVSEFSGNIVASNSSYQGASRIEFSKLAQDKISSIHATGEVEVILPASTPANLNLSSQGGNIYTDFDLEKAVKGGVGDPLEITVVGRPASVRRLNEEQSWTVESGSLTVNIPNRTMTERLTVASVAAAKRRNSKRYDYTLNGGGVYLSITSSGGDIYLKKK